MTDAAWQKSSRDFLFGYVKARYPILRPVLFWLERSRPGVYETLTRPAEDGTVFDLGGRALKCIHFPGHSPGSLILSDERTKTLYVGDAVNKGLFLFFEGSPPLKEYAARLRDLARLSGYDRIWDSHSEKPLPFSFIGYYADFLERAALEKSVKSDIPNGGNDVYIYKEAGDKFELPSIEVFYTKNLL